MTSHSPMKLFLFAAAIGMLAACATPDRVNQPRLFQNSNAAMLRFLNDNGLTASYTEISQREFFPPVSTSDEVLLRWGSYQEMVARQRHRDRRPLSAEGQRYTDRITTLESGVAKNLLLWAVVAEDVRLRLMIAEIRASQIAANGLQEAVRISGAVVTIVNTNSDIFSASDTETIAVIHADLQAALSERSAFVSSRASELCGSLASCSPILVLQSAGGFSRASQADFFFDSSRNDYLMVALESQVEEFAQRRALELHFYSLNQQAERNRVLWLEEQLAFFEDRRDHWMRARQRFNEYVRRSAYAHFDRFHDGSVRIQGIIQAVEEEASALSVGRGSLNRYIDLQVELRANLRMNDSSFSRFSEAILLGYPSGEEFFVE